MSDALIATTRTAGIRYEELLSRQKPALRKANGVYYTPAEIVKHVIRHTLGRLLDGMGPVEAKGIKILDPACGCGTFLVGVYQHLLDWHRDWYVKDGPAKHGRNLVRSADGSWHLMTAEKKRILLNAIHGVDLDLQAVELARQALTQASGGGLPRRPHRRDKLGGSLEAALASNIQCGDALIGPDFDRSRPNPIDWATAFPATNGSGGFGIVLGNPPWGQKDIVKDGALKEYLWRRYPSSAGIFDLFRPFVELGIRLTAKDGYFGMVLPDIVLLKDYPQTRRFLLDHLTLERIDTWGMAFSDAVIDAVTIIGRKKPAPPDHCVTVCTDPLCRQTAAIPQEDFRANPRHTFNLHLTPARRHVLDKLAHCPRLGDYFEVHEGVHSGNIRAELFVSQKEDDTCRELLFGRDEIAPYRLSWKGRYVRFGAVPERKTRQRYANIGQRQWHEKGKVLVRRTGDFVLAAVDREGRYASNNFFLVFPKQAGSLDLYGLCALLNSRFMTWYFRAIEPRQGRVFAELKIKHLAAFPLPMQVLETNGCATLNKLGSQRAAGFSPAVGPHRRAKPGGSPALDAQIDKEVLDLFGFTAADIE
jgi:hypothetical protein